MQSVAQAQNQPQEIFTHSLDTNYIVKHIPIETVWAELAEENPPLDMQPVRGHATNCPWHDDQVPSFHFAKNNRCKCHVCDVGKKYASNLDLVMRVLECEFPHALRWFQLHWDIPVARPGRPAGSRGAVHPFRVGFGGPLEEIIRSGLFSELCVPARLLLPVFVAVHDDRNECDWSYEALMQVTGIRSRKNIKTGTEELRRIRAISIRKFFRHSEKVPRQAYRLTLDDPDLAKRIEQAHGAHRFANEQTRALAALNRRARSHHKKPA